MCDPEDPLFTPSLLLARPPFQHFFSSQDSIFTPKLQIFNNFKPKSLKIGKEFSFKASNWATLQFTRLHFVKKSSSQGCQIWQWSVHKPLCSSLRATHYESWVPPQAYNHHLCHILHHISIWSVFFFFFFVFCFLLSKTVYSSIRIKFNTSTDKFIPQTTVASIHFMWYVHNSALHLFYVLVINNTAKLLFQQSMHCTVTKWWLLQQSLCCTLTTQWLPLWRCSHHIIAPKMVATGQWLHYTGYLLPWVGQCGNLATRHLVGNCTISAWAMTRYTITV